MNVLAIEPRTHNVLIKRAYDTSESKEASRQLGRDLRSLASGTIVMVAVRDDAVGALSSSVYQYFASQGATAFADLARGEKYVYIGVKDQKRQAERKGPGVGVGMVLSFSETETE